MSSALEPLLIIGYGNLLRGDDAVGRHIARELRSRGLPAIETDQLTPELAEPLSQVQRAVFIDSDATLAPGEVRRTSIEPASEPLLGHSFHPGALVNFTRLVYGRAPAAEMIGIGAEHYDFGGRLSCPVNDAKEKLIAYLSTSVTATRV